MTGHSPQISSPLRARDVLQYTSFMLLMLLTCFGVCHLGSSLVQRLESNLVFPTLHPLGASCSYAPSATASLLCRPGVCYRRITHRYCFAWRALAPPFANLRSRTCSRRRRAGLCPAKFREPPRPPSPNAVRPSLSRLLPPKPLTMTPYVTRSSCGCCSFRLL